MRIFCKWKHVMWIPKVADSSSFDSDPPFYSGCNLRNIIEHTHPRSTYFIFLPICLRDHIFFAPRDRFSTRPTFLVFARPFLRTLPTAQLFAHQEKTFFARNTLFSCTPTHQYWLLVHSTKFLSPDCQLRFASRFLLLRYRFLLFEKCEIDQTEISDTLNSVLFKLQLHFSVTLHFSAAPTSLRSKSTMYLPINF